jgi:NADH-quinone oxidoreductase subunit F
VPEHVVLRHRDHPGLERLEVYLEKGGFEAFRKTVTGMTPAQVIEEVKASGLRGRGGAGFPTGVKWSFLTPNVYPRYVVANADESEPGTFKDREILERNPFQFLEGVAICAYAAQAEVGYVYLRGEFWELAHLLDGHLAALRGRGLLGKSLFGTAYNHEIHTHLGAGAYICARDASWSWKEARPARLRRRFRRRGLLGKPTVINNVETLANLPPILARGAAWYRTLGTEKSPGTKVFSLSGRVVRPGNFELPLGTTFRELIFTHGGGIPDGRRPKGILPAGASSTILPADERILDTPMDYESVQAAGSALGSASVIVLDETTDLAWVALKTSSFFKHESCGKCTPCLRNVLMLHLANRFERARAQRRHRPAGYGRLSDPGKCLCALGSP